MAVAADAPLPGRPARPTVARGARFDRWTITTLVLAGLLALPILAVVVTALRPSDDIWRHLVSTVLGDYVRNTLLLMLGVGIGTFVLGAGAAWLVSTFRFPGRALFEWALVLPLAVPAYIIAFVYTDLLDYAGPVQTWLRTLFGWTTKRDYWFPEIRSLGGAIVMLTLVLYPYVYLLGRAAFLRQSRSAVEASRMLGRGPTATFFTVVLPLARPALVVGVSLALMETLNDFGTVSFFAVRTFTAGIYDVWLNQYNVAGAAQLASSLLIFVLAVLGLERWSRRGQHFDQAFAGLRPMPRQRLFGWRAGAALAACALPVALGFVLPGLILLELALTWGTYRGVFVYDLARSLALAAGAGLLAVCIGLLLAYGLRLRKDPLVRVATRVASVGYAVPGSVIAVGVLLPFAWLDNTVDGLARSLLGVGTGLLLSGTAAAVVFAYLVRFNAVALGAIESGLAKVTRNMDDAARTLGQAPGGVLMRVHVPILKGSILTALILVFVDVLKELPATLLLRPFNFNTLATRVYELAADQRFEEASLPALTIVAAGILPVIVLVRAMRPRKER
jgi:iron(III) transport system permease protein